MPQINLDIVSTSDRLPVRAGRLIDYGMLFCLSAAITQGTSRTGRTHIQVGTYNGVPDEYHLISLLIDDYVYDGHVPSWSGRVPIEAGCGIIAILRSADLVTIRIAGNILKYDP